MDKSIIDSCESLTQANVGTKVVPGVVFQSFSKPSKQKSRITHLRQRHPSLACHEALTAHFVDLLTASYGDETAACFLFVTVTFSVRNLVKDLSRNRLNTFGVLYNQTCRLALGKNHHRQSEAVPRVVALIDAEGSRYADRLVSPVNIHIHSVWAVRDDQRALIEKHIPEAARCRYCLERGVETIDIRSVERKELYKVIAYARKLGFYNNESPGYEQDFEVYPRGRRRHHTIWTVASAENRHPD
ncbi:MULTISPECIES: hypothetical protein [unclassified Chelatococcus]|uniref:hypothetical protein n=1 Tax=unclassified Chelatococcus TaxID=2638111 RepID=UPI001BD0FA4C|nr:MULTISPECIES: hypothetical protein [unclassified Chelatococcus]CAH1662093.1 conserved hypothetical protein [Hyphomicrobiales bacterium]MBS7743525.1 hypothetical protein [Chelatococcus sp. HY11]MBS7743694.1 hypothetical protein [Chelatococcus sp. HY11]MBX3547205.1 hypothetical protein [Chelatococcus sp.]CAH1664391.1 conserved hypothetical protein [Hyphomicrobiales bacterium]